MRYLVIILLIFLGSFALVAQQQQIAIPRISQMPDFPNPYVMRDWKSVAGKYDTLVFTTIEGTHFPLLTLGNKGVNYPEITPIFLDSYVGSGSHGNDREAINILPAIVGASLVGINKSSQFSTNWVEKTRDFYNLRNNELVYLNGPSDRSGHDWWYETMPNIFFYQLYDLYPDTPDFESHFRSVADRWLAAVQAMGGSSIPWEVPEMNYRAWNLIEMIPLDEGVIEPEAAGAIGWILYQAYKELADKKYLIGAQWSMEFLDGLDKNPSYELQLPYGVLAAAMMNAEVGTNYDIEKMLSWCFDKGELRGWGSVLGAWGGMDVSGLIGEANDQGDDYAFAMNGYQQASALVPLIKYDKRFAASIAKWVLNVANASRLYYADFTKENQQSDYAWCQTYDTNSVIAYEALKEKWLGEAPYARGDAKDAGWGETNLALYGSSHVGYLGAIIAKTNVEGILRLDLNITNFFGENPFPTYALYNPFEKAKMININTGDNAKDIYDAISETILLENIMGDGQVSIPAGEVLLLSYIPAGSLLDYGATTILIGEDVLDFNYGYDFQPKLRIKSLATNSDLVKKDSEVLLYCTVNLDQDVTFDWFIDNVLVATDNSSGLLSWIPEEIGINKIKVVVHTDDTMVKDSLEIEVVDLIPAPPLINEISADKSYYTPGEVATITANVADPNDLALTYNWSSDFGQLTDPDKPSTRLVLPVESGVYVVKLTVTNSMDLIAMVDYSVLSLNDQPLASPLVYLPLDGNTLDFSGSDYEVLTKGRSLSYYADAMDQEDRAVGIFSAGEELEVRNTPFLDFSEAISVSCWVSFSDFSGERFVLSHGSWEQRWKLSATPDQKMRWTVNTSSAIRDLDSETLLQKNTWYHVVAIYDGQSMQLLIDGQLESFASHTGLINAANVGITIGKSIPGDDRYFLRGLVDEVKIFDQPLGITQAATLRSQKCADCIVESLGFSENKSVGLRVYPIPASDQLTIESNMPILTVNILDFSGKLRSTSVKSKVNNSYQIDISGLASGIYFVNIFDGKHATSTRVIKQ